MAGKPGGAGVIICSRIRFGLNPRYLVEGFLVVKEGRNVVISFDTRHVSSLH
jgi:hypothetical protein